MRNSASVRLARSELGCGGQKQRMGGDIDRELGQEQVSTTRWDLMLDYRM